MTASYIKKGFSKQTLVRYKGDTYPDSFRLWSDNTKQTPLDITSDHTFVMTVASDLEAGTVAAFSVNGQIVVPGTSGEVAFAPSAENTNTPAAGTYYYNVLMTAPSGQLTIAAGKYVIVEDIG